MDGVVYSTSASISVHFPLHLHITRPPAYSPDSPTDMASGDNAFDQYPYTLASDLDAAGPTESQVQGAGSANGGRNEMAEGVLTSEAQRETEAALDHLLGADLDHGRFHDDSTAIQGESDRDAQQDRYDATAKGQSESWTAIPSSSNITSTHLNASTLANSISPVPQGDDPSLGQDDTGADEGVGAEADSRPKRKATSRANMLARGGACEFCKRRKLKCSAEEPSCAQCLKMRKECVYSQVKQRSRVRVLEDRLAELEKRLTAPEAVAGAFVPASAASKTRDGATSADQRVGQDSAQGQAQDHSQLDTSFYGLLPTPESIGGGSGGHGSILDTDSSGASPWASLVNAPLSGMAQPFATYGLSNTMSTQSQASASMQHDHAQANAGREAVFDKSLFPQPDNLSIPALPHSYPGNTPFNHAPMPMLTGTAPSTIRTALSNGDTPTEVTLRPSSPAEPDLTGMIQAAASPGATATFARIEAGHAPWEGLSADVLAQVLMCTMLGKAAKGGDGGCDPSVGESLVSHLYVAISLIHEGYHLSAADPPTRIVGYSTD